MQPGAEVKFKVGDKAVYPAQGVAEVIKIEEKDIAGTRQRFYVLRILDTDRKIMVPVMNAGAVGLRQVISEQEIREIFDILKERTIAFDNQTWNRRYRGFMDKIKTGSIYDVAEVLRDLYRLKTDKQLSFGERRMLDTARTLIVKEIAIARAQTEEQVEGGNGLVVAVASGARQRRTGRTQHRGGFGELLVHIADERRSVGASNQGQASLIEPAR
jgi:CarD family transcriptional regulator